jgi:1,2-diacylglycerol 3-alpha-glucosyltransferase
MSASLKIAVGASGLSHVARGIEAWAEETAGALQRAGEQVTLFQGTGTSDPPYRITLDSMSRMDPRALAWPRRLRRCGLWRVGLSYPYDYEQLSYTIRLWKKVRHDYDIVHVQDPLVALWMTYFHRWGLSRPRVILGHGTEEPPSTLVHYQALQHLAPVYLEDWEKHRPPGQAVFGIPNFIDVQRYRAGDQQAARAAWDIPADAFVLLTVAALKKRHKRVDYVIREISQLPVLGSRPVLYIVAGAREEETDEIVQLSRDLLGDRGRVLINVPREKVLSLYQAADVFVMGSLHEMLSVAFAEALACGLPVCCNDSPTLKWMAGGAAEPNRLTEPGALLQQLAPLASAEERQRRSLLARQRAVEVFSEQAVVPQLQEMYRQVMARVP